eukprot:m.40842 g.40842  ORF g.40842 m.40842 type:complete len:1172 (+) comp10383_c0_seq1:31-3546(+)
MDLSEIREEISQTVKQLQRQFVEKGGHIHFDGNCLLAIQLCISIDRILFHGLKKKYEKKEAYFPFVKQFCRKDEITALQSLKVVKTNRGRGRAFIRNALNERSLESYFLNFISNASLLNKYYDKNAFLRRKDDMDVIATILSGLESLQFFLPLDVSGLDPVKGAGLTVSAMPKDPIVHVPMMEPKISLPKTLTESNNSNNDKKNSVDETHVAAIRQRIHLAQGGVVEVIQQTKKKKKKKKGESTTTDVSTQDAPGEKKPKKLSKMALAIKKEREARERAEAKKREEEERKRKEEEEQQRIFEEELRREDERRAKKREKEKQRKARRKAEGKSKADKERAAQARRALEQMRQQGIVVAALDNPSDDKDDAAVDNNRKADAEKEEEHMKQGKAQLANDEVTETKKIAQDENVEEDDCDDDEDDWENEISSGDEDGSNEDENGSDKSGNKDGSIAATTTTTSISIKGNTQNDDDEEDEDEIIDPRQQFVEKLKQKAQRKPRKSHKKKSNTNEDAHNDDGADDDEEDDDEDDYDSDNTNDSYGEEEQDDIDDEDLEARKYRARQRIAKRKEENEKAKDLDTLRSPVCAVLGHVDTGKTKILDRIRHTNVQDGEAGGITQQIGATYLPAEEMKKQTEQVPKGKGMEYKIPGLLVIDTPGHEAFSNLRVRGSNICNIAILVVDIMHGIEPQTRESIELLRKQKAPFVVALNKIDRLNEWVAASNTANKCVINRLKKQKQHTMQDFDTRLDYVKLQFAEMGINTELYWKNKNMREYVNIVPTSAHTGEGIPDLLFLLVSLSQRALARELAFSKELECTVLEVKEVQGYGMTIDVILTNGTIREGDTLVLGGLEGPIVTTARSLLMPAPMKELRVKNAYTLHKKIVAAQGVKVAGKSFEKAIAGLPLFVAHDDDEIEVYKEDAERLLQETLNAIKTVDKGVCVQASTLGSLEALMVFLKSEKIPVSAVNIGPVHRKDVTRCTIQLGRDKKYACILAFDVPIDADAQKLAKKEGIKIFTADIIYHLEEAFTDHLKEVKRRLQEENKYKAIFPCKLKIIPECVFNARAPIVVGVKVVEGIVKEGTILCVPAKEMVEIGVVASLEFDHQKVETAKKGQEVSVRIHPLGGEKKMVGRHFEVEDELVSKISRESIDAVKEYFREDLGKEDWKLMVKLKKLFKIL